MNDIIRLSVNDIMGKNIHIQSAEGFTDIGLHWHSYYELIYFFEGEVVSIINGIEMPLNKGTLYMLTPVDLHHTLKKDKKAKLKFINISFTENIIDEKLRQEMNGAYYIPSVDNKTLAIIELLTQPKATDEETQHLINALLYNVIRKEYKFSKTGKTVLDKNIHKAIRYIAENFNENIDLKTLSNYLHITPSYFSFLFSKTCGCTFKEYLTNYRISYAKELLKSTNKSVTDICYSCGFSNLPNFLRVFKKQVGKTPSTYKKGLNVRT